MMMMMMKTERLLLRPWEESDAAALYALASTPDIGPRCGWRPHTCEEESADIIRNVFTGEEICAVVLRASGEVIGSVGVIPLEGLWPDRPELGYWLGKPYWGRGLIPEAAREMIRRAFEELCYEELWCAHFDFNAQSRRVIEKCGFHFRYEKVRTCSDGIPHLTRYYVLTRREWETAR